MENVRILDETNAVYHTLERDSDGNIWMILTEEGKDYYELGGFSYKNHVCLYYKYDIKGTKEDVIEILKDEITTILSKAIEEVNSECGPNGYTKYTQDYTVDASVLLEILNWFLDV